MPDMGTPSDWDKLTPAQKQAAMNSILQLGGLQQQSSSLDDQIAQAAALRKPGPAQNYYGAAAGALGGIGEGLRQIGGAVSENRYRAEQAKLQPQIAALREKYAGLTIPTADPAAQQAPAYAPVRPAQMIGPAQLAPTAPPASSPRRRPLPPAVSAGGIPESVMRNMGLL